MKAARTETVLAEDYLAVPQEELERDVYATGFFRQKAKAVRGTMRVLLEELDGRVPRTIPELLRLPGVAETVNLDHIKAGYYSIKALNPTGIVPLGPVLDFAAPHGREELGRRHVQRIVLQHAADDHRAPDEVTEGHREQVPREEGRPRQAVSSGVGAARVTFATALAA